MKWWIFNPPGSSWNGSPWDTGLSDHGLSLCGAKRSSSVVEGYSHVYRYSHDGKRMKNKWFGSYCIIDQIIQNLNTKREVKLSKVASFVSGQLLLPVLSWGRRNPRSLASGKCIGMSRFSLEMNVARAGPLQVVTTISTFHVPLFSHQAISSRLSIAFRPCVPRFSKLSLKESQGKKQIWFKIGKHQKAHVKYWSI